MDCKLVEQEGSTKVTVNADVQLSGSIAQFGRTGLLTEIANTMVADFVRNAEAKMVGAGGNADAVAANDGATAAPAAAKPISVFSLLASAFKGWLRSLLKGGR